MNIQYCENAEHTKEETDSVQAIQQRYATKQYHSQMKVEQRLLVLSFTEVKQHKHLLKGIYNEVEQYYLDAQIVYDSKELQPKIKKKLLYKIYDLYYEKLASLSFSKRRIIHADAHIRKMHRAIKKGWDNTAFIQYWIRFAKICLPPLIVGFLGEFVFLSLLYTDTAVWIVALSLAVFVIGFGSYTILVLELEGKRLYSDLQKWISYKINPEEQDKPYDIVQYMKMAVPLMAAVISAIIKLYM